ncbi:ROK family protein [Vagococcus intermedius]|uniref:ROK family protein n=1 Tax=Vagococcus intermedius TaxID=2991418 RepID=A0AAF0CTK2_9ENTE|nr:ROK family protein [Vagococcus intermedius]WEG72596.1 ROK family protein [Vagococcus intermedius]WEG74682.1 ROK family protein [Vagococcus intermedius]
MSRVLCFDIGGTGIKAAVYEQNGQKVRSYPSRPTRSEEQSILEIVIEMTGIILREEQVIGIAIASAGVINSQTGTVIYSGYTIPNYTGTELKKNLEGMFGLPCEVENDVNAACLAESWKGAAKGCQSAVCLTIGTGVGGAILLNNQLVKGVGFTAGEIGYLPVAGDYFQNSASTSALIKRANELDDIKQYENGKEIFDLAQKGNRFCQQAIDEFITQLSTGLVMLIYLFNPEIIVLGGGIMSQKGTLHVKIKESVTAQLISPIFNKTRIEFAENKNDAGMLGALYHFNKQQIQ